MTKVLALDCDGVLYNWHNAVYEYFILYRNYKGSFNKLWEVDYKLLNDADWEFLTNVDYFYSSQVPTKDCVDFLNDVKFRFDIYYVTGRPIYVKTTTEQFLKRYKFPFRDNLIFADDKVNTARRLKADYFIEDMPRHLEGLSKITNVIMMAQPYNKEYWDTYLTVHSLKSALQYLED
jgi:uncharacterized HAD superfamily protein